MLAGISFGSGSQWVSLTLVIFFGGPFKAFVVELVL